MRALLKGRDPQACVLTRVHSSSRTSLWHGLGQGVSCVICCAGPMLILLVLRAMNLAVMVLVTAIIALEKLVPKPEMAVLISGFIFSGARLFMMIRLLF
jgi:predicted metal-binding membrane protein